MTNKQAQQILRDAGFPIPVDGRWGLWSRRALRDACRAFAFTKEQCGFRRPKIGGRLNKNRIKMLNYIKANSGKCSKNFRYVEFRCKGVTRGMHRPEDNWIRISRRLIIQLEKYRAVYGPVAIISGGRSTSYNKAVGGASLSQHRYAWRPRLVCKAVDVNPKAKVQELRNRGWFGGLGYNVSTGLVAHVDIRKSPATWYYNR